MALSADFLIIYQACFSSGKLLRYIKYDFRISI